MQVEYVRENKIIEKTEREKELELIRNIINVKEDLQNANKNFEYAEDELVDYYTYEIKANQSKLDYLIRLAKTKGIAINMVNQIEIRLCREEYEAG